MEVMTPTDFVVLANQTLEYAYPVVLIEGEIKNFRVSRGKWLYFDVADNYAKIKCFGTVYVMPGPIEDGMIVRVVANPRLHPQYGFSLNIQSISFSGVGSIKKASDLLKEKLEKEGLFAVERKRVLSYPPSSIGLITSAQSAAYHDFVKVLSARFGGINIELADVAVQGDQASEQIVRAVEWFNSDAELVDVLVIIRGGGSADDLQAFSTEQVVRAVSSSRIPTLVAIGHEIDVSLAELSADVRASTPSNAAELLVPERTVVLSQINRHKSDLNTYLLDVLDNLKITTKTKIATIEEIVTRRIQGLSQDLLLRKKALEVLNPQAVFARGYAVVRLKDSNRAILSKTELQPGSEISVQFSDGEISASVH